MKKLPRISESELILMEIIWAHFPISGNDVVSKLDDEINWHFRTVKTMLGRMVKKGALTYEKQQKTYLYSPLIERDHYVKKASESFIKRMFSGDKSQALTYFVESAELTQDQIKQLRELLDSKSRE